jgi:hypothetical protein
MSGLRVNRDLSKQLYNLGGMSRRTSLRFAFLFLALFATMPKTPGQSAKEKREAAYQAALKSYSEILKPGMTRKNVEDYLKAKGVKYVRMRCIDEQTAWVDIVSIGKEKHPWYCSAHNVYIAFQFADEPHEGVRPSDRDTDKLKSITVHHSLEGCL